MDVMHQKLVSMETFEDLSNSANGMGLLMCIRTLVFNFRAKNTYPPYFTSQNDDSTSAHKVNTSVQSVQSYLETFQNAVNVV
jgi:hypothetical protein